MEIGKEILGCVLVWVPVSGWNDFRGGGCPFVLTQLTSSPFVLIRFFFLAQLCAIFYQSIMCTGFGGQITGWFKHIHICGRLSCRKISWIGLPVCNLFSVSVSNGHVLCTNRKIRTFSITSARQYCTIKKYSQLAIVTHVQTQYKHVDCSFTPSP